MDIAWKIYDGFWPWWDRMISNMRSEDWIGLTVWGIVLSLVILSAVLIMTGSKSRTGKMKKGKETERRRLQVRKLVSNAIFETIEALIEKEKITSDEAMMHYRELGPLYPEMMPGLTQKATKQRIKRRLYGGNPEVDEYAPVKLPDRVNS